MPAYPFHVVVRRIEGVADVPRPAVRQLTGIVAASTTPLKEDREDAVPGLRVWNEAAGPLRKLRDHLKAEVGSDMVPNHALEHVEALLRHYDASVSRRRGHLLTDRELILVRGVMCLHDHGLSKPVASRVMGKVLMTLGLAAGRPRAQPGAKGARQKVKALPPKPSSTYREYLRAIQNLDAPVEATAKAFEERLPHAGGAEAAELNDALEFLRDGSREEPRERKLSREDRLRYYNSLATRDFSDDSLVHLPTHLPPPGDKQPVSRLSSGGSRTQPYPPLHDPAPTGRT